LETRRTELFQSILHDSVCTLEGLDRVRKKIDAEYCLWLVGFSEAHPQAVSSYSILPAVPPLRNKYRLRPLRQPRRSQNYSCTAVRISGYHPRSQDDPHRPMALCLRLTHQVRLTKDGPCHPATPSAAMLTKTRSRPNLPNMQRHLPCSGTFPPLNPPASLQFPGSRYLPNLDLRSQDSHLNPITHVWVEI
jgi:hypothetical protein